MQFSLKTLMAVVAAVAVVCGVFFGIPDIACFIVSAVVILLIPPALIAGIVYGRGSGRAFSIGALAAGGCLPLITLYLGVYLFQGMWELWDSPDIEDAIVFKITLAIYFGLVGLSGVVSLVIRSVSIRLQRVESKNTVATEIDTHLSNKVLHGRVTTERLVTSNADTLGQANTDGIDDGG